MIGSRDTKQRKPKCGRCRIHGKLEDLALHNQSCPHRNCTCKLCLQHLENKRKTAIRIKKYRDEMKEKSRTNREMRRRIDEPDGETSHSSHSNRQPMASSLTLSTKPPTSESYPPFASGANYGNLENVEDSRPPPPLFHVMQYCSGPFQYSSAYPSTSGGYPSFSFGARDEGHSRRESARSEDLENAVTSQSATSNIYTMQPFLSYLQFSSTYPSANWGNGEHSATRNVENAESSSTQVMRIPPTPFPTTWAPPSSVGGHPLFVFNTSSVPGHSEIRNLRNVESSQPSPSNMPNMPSHSMPSTYTSTSTRSPPLIFGVGDGNPEGAQTSETSSSNIPTTPFHLMPSTRPSTSATYPPFILGADNGSPESVQTPQSSLLNMPTIPLHSMPPAYPSTNASSYNPLNHGAQLVRRAYENLYSAYHLPYLFHNYPGLRYMQNLPYPPFVPLYIGPGRESAAAVHGTTSNDAALEESGDGATAPAGESSDDEIEV